MNSNIQMEEKNILMIFFSEGGSGNGDIHNIIEIFSEALPQTRHVKRD